MFKRLLQLAQPKMIIVAVLVIAAAVVALAYFASTAKPVGTYVMPTVGPITEEVDTTGTVTAAQTLDLAFQIGGRIAYAGPAVGTHVAQGVTLASLSSADLAASVEQAKAALAVQQANLDALLAGSRPEDVAVAQTAVTGAQSSVTQAKQSVAATAQDAYAKADDAIHNKVDQFFSNPRGASPSLDLTLSDSQLQSSIVAGRSAMEQLLTSWQEQVAAIPTENPDAIDTASLASTTRANLQAVGSYLDLVANGLTKAVPTTTYTASTIQTYESNVATARANISADLSAIDAAETAEKAAESSLASAQSQLALTQAPPTQQALEAQQAQVAAAQANVDAAQAQLAQTVIYAPIAGTITVNNANVGETAVASSPIISMISDSRFQFDTYVSEADIAKVKVGQSAQIQLDAYQGQTGLPAHVIAVDPAATVQGGIASYKVTLQFDDNDPRIQAGLTGSANITTASSSNAISVPTSAIITRGDQKFVIRKTASGSEDVPVSVGISSASGYTQILTGISPSDQIMTFGTAQ